MKTVYQCDDRGFYLYTIQAHESPLEPGVYLLPGGCVEIEPPVVAEDLIPVFENGAWKVIARELFDESYKSAKVIAKEWRDAELSRADIQLNKVQDGMKIGGTVNDWRKYRVALRVWPDAEDFPVNAPVAPDVVV